MIKSNYHCPNSPIHCCWKVFKSPPLTTAQSSAHVLTFRFHSVCVAKAFQVWWTFLITTPLKIFVPVKALWKSVNILYWTMQFITNLKVFKVSTDEAIDLIQVGSGLSALDIELRHRRSSFVHKLSCSTNSIIIGLFALKLWTGSCSLCLFFFLFSCVLSLYCFLSIFVCLSVCYPCGE